MKIFKKKKRFGVLFFEIRREAPIFFLKFLIFFFEKSDRRKNLIFFWLFDEKSSKIVLFFDFSMKNRKKSFIFLIFFEKQVFENRWFFFENRQNLKNITAANFHKIVRSSEVDFPLKSDGNTTFSCVWPYCRFVIIIVLQYPILVRHSKRI